MFKKAIILIAPLFFCVNSQTYPNQNCPVFRYDNQNGITVGRVELPNDYSGDYRISINMSVAAYLTQSENIQIQRLTETSDIRRGLPLVYHIIFPIQNVLPKPTRIEFNQKLYCIGMQESLTPGRQGITNFWATDYVGTGGTILRPVTRPGPIGPPPIQPIIFEETSTIPNIIWSPVSRPTSLPVTYTIRTMSTISRPTRRPPINPIPSSENCGVVRPPPPISMPLILDGTNVTENQFPWLAAIMYKGKDSNLKTHEYRCTGSLVSNKHVITAGHCIKFQNALLYDADEILIILGEFDIGFWITNDAIVTSGVSDISVHPDYNSTNGDSDIAVFTLSKQIKFTSSVIPICIWNEDEDLDLVVRQPGSVAGWGSDRSGNAKVEFAAYVELPIVSQVDCLRSNPKFRTQTSSRTFCAGNRDGKGPCNGDSGAGFMMLRNNRWTLRGIVSRSLNDVNTCDVDNYIIFADIAKVRGWLNEVLK